MAKLAELISNNNEILYPKTVASQVLTNEVNGEKLPQVLDRIDRDIASVTNEVVNARTDNKTPSTTHPNLKARLDDLDGRLTTLDITTSGNTNEIANITTNLNAFNKEVEQARTDNQNPAHTYNSLKERLDADVERTNEEIKKTNEEIKKTNVEIEKTNTQLSQKVSIVDNNNIVANEQELMVERKSSLRDSLYDNKLDRNIVTVGYYNQPDGRLDTSTYNWITPLIPVGDVKTIIIRNPIAKPMRLNEYDKDKNFIKNTNNTSKNTTELIVNLLPDTRFILLGGNNTTLDTMRMYFVYKDVECNIDGKTYVAIEEKVSNNKSINVEEFEFKDTYTKTKYWITHIPRHDAYGNINELKLGFANNMITGDIFPETTRSFANRNNATVCINAGVSWSAYGGNEYYNKDGQKCNKMHGLRVYDHMLVSNDIESNWYKKTHWALGITDDGLLVSFGTADAVGDMTMSYDESQRLGCKFVTSAFTPIMLNGTSQKNVLQYTNQWVNDRGENVYYQRQVIGQNTATKDIFILTSNGKGTGKNVDGLVIDGGMTLDDCIAILQTYGCDFAYQLDEGGSTSLVYKGKLLNDKTDDSMKSERLLSDFLYVASTPVSDRDKDIAYLQQEIGELKEKMNTFNKIFLDNEADSTREIQRRVDGSLKHSLNLKNNAIQYYDSTTKGTYFQADTTGLFTSLLGGHGYFPKGLSLITNTDFPKYNTVFVYPQDLEGAPFIHVRGYVIHLIWGSQDNQMQIAFPYATNHDDSDTYPKYRTKTVKDNGAYTWNDWRPLHPVKI